jgi:hypothetical protein
MGTGSGLAGFNSKVFTNSFAYKNNTMYAPYYFQMRGDSFYGLSKPQYSFQVYRQLSALGANAGGRGERWNRANGVKSISFIPPINYTQI